MEDINNRGWKQDCGYEIFPIKKSFDKIGYWDCYILKEGIKYIFNAKKIDIIKGTVSIYRIQEAIFINSIHPQNSGDKCKILQKIEGNKNEYKIEFLDYPFVMIAKKGLILKGEVLNPQIEQVEFIDKVWKQNCGDSLKIIKKIEQGQEKGKWEVEFIKYPYRKFAYKKAILLGNVLNPKIEEEEFINKIHPQNCGDSLRIVKKSNIKDIDGSFLWEVEFINTPYKTICKKCNILEHKVENKNIIWYSKEKLEEYIKKNYIKEKPTLKQLSEDLKISYSHIARRIKALNLGDLCRCGEYKQYEIKNILKEILDEEEIISEYWDKDLKQEIDFYIPKFNIGFEYNGNYWHSNLFKEQNYHQQKVLIFQNKGIRIFHIWEWEFEENFTKIKNYILNICKENSKNIFYARKCVIKELSDIEYQDFCEENHLQGKCGARVKLGLFYKDELIQIMSFGCPRFNNKYEWEIIRECSKLEYRVIGGKEKLWSHFVKKYNPNSVISYCDFSKFDGNSYLKLGFEKERLNRPGFKWWDNKKHIVLDRTPWKHKELKEFLKIYDCGQLVFVWKKDLQ